jgi:hypothetical protein
MPAAAAAQSPGAVNSSTDTTLAQTLTAAPIPGQTGVAITAGATMLAGRTETKGWTLDGIVSYTTSKRLVMRFEAEAARNDYRVAHGQPYTKIQDNAMALALVLKPIHKHFSLVATGGWARDALLDLDHRVWIEGGLGIHLVDTPHVNFMVAPLYAFGDEARTFTEVAGRVNDVGILQSFSLKLGPRFTFDEYLSAHADLSSTRDSSTMFNVSALSELAPHLNLKVYYQYNYAELAPPGQDPLQTTVGFALQVQFMRTPKPPAAAPTPPPAKP